MREASRSLAIAFNIGRIQEVLYRLDAGQQADPDDKGLLEQAVKLFVEARRGFEWTQATVAGVGGEDVIESRAFRSLNFVLPTIKNYPQPVADTLSILTEVATKLRNGSPADPNHRRMFDTVLGDLASSAGNRLDELVEERNGSVSLRSLRVS